MKLAINGLYVIVLERKSVARFFRACLENLEPSGTAQRGQMKGKVMKRQEFRDRFSDASIEQQEKSGYIHKSNDTQPTKKPRASLTQKITSGISFKDPSPFGP